MCLFSWSTISILKTINSHIKGWVSFNKGIAILLLKITTKILFLKKTENIEKQIKQFFPLIFSLSETLLKLKLKLLSKNIYSVNILCPVGP